MAQNLAFLESFARQFVHPFRAFSSRAEKNTFSSINSKLSQNHKWKIWHGRPWVV
jgi:hypothetical protein